MIGLVNVFFRKEQRPIESTDAFEYFPMVALKTDQTGHILNVNKLFLEETGFHQIDVIGKRLEDVLNQGSRAYLKNHLYPYLNKKGFCRDIPCQLIGKAGYSTDCQLSMFLENIGEEDKFILCFLKQLPNEFEIQSHFYKNLKELSDYKFALDVSAIVGITDVKGDITFVNDLFCKISKYSREELMGQNHRILKSGYHTKEFFRNMWRQISSSYIWKGQVKNRAKDGSYYWVQTTIIPCLNDRGKPEKYISIRQDITTQKEAEMIKQEKEILEQANQAKSEFLANMSHEIRTPLSVIVGLSEFLSSNDQSPNKMSDFLKRIQNNANHLKELIDDVLDLSKIEAGKLEIENVLFELKSEISKVLDGLQAQAERKGLNFKVNYSADLPVVITSDPGYLRQIVFNIVGNALKFTETGEILISVSVEPKELNSTLRIIVKDTGCGIPQEGQRQLFEPFSQSENSVKRNYGGTGLGLALSKKLAQALGGDIVLDRSEKEKGSTFVITLDAGVLKTDYQKTCDRFQRMISTDSLAEESKPLDGLRVLLVEDCLDVALVGVSFLKRSGANVEVAENGKLAVEKALSRSFDIILMDIQMPVLDGFGALSSLKDSNYRGPIVAVTARALKEEKDRCLEAGFDDCLTKPYRAKSLIQIVTDLSARP